VAVFLVAHCIWWLKRRPIGNPVAALGDTDGASAAKFLKIGKSNAKSPKPRGGTARCLLGFGRLDFRI
jgi:hypothetical protein